MIIKPEYLPRTPSTHVFLFYLLFWLAQGFAQEANQNLNAFFHTDQPLYLEKLSADSFNPPFLVYSLEKSIRAPLGVIKFETDKTSAEIRMQVLDSMYQGCKLIPRVLRGGNGDYLIELKGRYYSCMEYIEQKKRPLSLEEMLQLTSQFHQYTKECHLVQSSFQKTLDWFSTESSHILHLNPQLINWDPSLFTASSWKQCERSARYFITTEFREIYDQLPIQVIHGDIVDHNIICSSTGLLYLIDFESMRTDIRLRDFATFFSVNFLDQFLALLKKHQLKDCLQTYYGDLEDIEIACLPWIVLLERCCALAWSLDELAKAVTQQDEDKIKQFCQRAKEAISKIDQICLTLNF